jgi:flavin-dependent dehydrogenase
VIASGDGLPEISAAWAVAADGLHSHARRLLGAEGAPESPGRRRFGLRRHYRVPPWSDVVEVHWADEFEAYVTPLGPGLVGVALLGSWRRPADFDAELRAVPDVAARLAGAAADGPVRGAGPLRQRTVARVAGRVVLAGDASGYVDALTGEGLRVGFAQAEAAVRAVAAGDLSRYEREWSRATREARVVTSALVAAARSPLRGRIAPVARRRPELFGSVVERLAR